MKLTRTAETIIAEDSRASLHKCVTELEKDKDVLRRVVDHGIEDYNLLVAGNKSLASEHDELKSHCQGLQAKLANTRCDIKKRVATLEVEVKSAEAHNIDVVSIGEKHLREFEGGLV
jgi:hypothetical protein